MIFLLYPDQFFFYCQIMIFLQLRLLSETNSSYSCYLFSGRLRQWEGMSCGYQSTHSNSQSITFKPISPLLALDVSLQVPISSSYRSVPVLVDEHASVGHGRPLSARVDLPLDQVVHLVLAAGGLRGLVVVRVDGGPSVHAVWVQRGSPADVDNVLMIENIADDLKHLNI